MKLSIVILSFNTSNVTLACLKSLAAVTDLQWGRDFEVVVVDNNSNDDSVAMIKQEYPSVKLVESEENLGFAKGNNLGERNTKRDTEYVLFLNSDTVVPNGTLSEMILFMDDNQDVGVSTCKVDLWTGDFDWDCHRGFPTPWVSFTRLAGLHRLFPKSKIFNQYNQGWKDLQATHDVDAVVGAFMLVPRKIGGEISWWDEDYFLNGEDLDFCYCVKEKGYRVVYHPKVAITHYRGASKGTRKESKEVTTASEEGKMRVANASVDAMGLFYNKHYRSKYPSALNVLTDFGLKLLRMKRVQSV